MNLEEVRTWKRKEQARSERTGRTRHSSGKTRVLESSNYVLQNLGFTLLLLLNIYTFKLHCFVNNYLIVDSQYYVNLDYVELQPSRAEKTAAAKAQDYLGVPSGKPFKRIQLEFDIQC